jgi:predicted molibdopterin-dependent oxidoreductase YjgC
MVVINDNQHKFIPNLNAIEFCKIYSVKIPTLCYLKEFNHRAKCGFCLIKVNGKIVLACNTIIKKNDIIVTNDQQLIAVRKNILININKRYSASIKQNHRFSQLLNEYQIETRTNNGLVKKITNNKPFNLIPNKCIGCGRCISICKSCVYNNQPCLKLDKNQRVSFVKKN